MQRRFPGFAILFKIIIELIKLREFRKLFGAYFLLCFLVTLLGKLSTSFFFLFIFSGIEENNLIKVVIASGGWLICCIWTIWGKRNVVIKNERNYKKIFQLLNHKYLLHTLEMKFETISKNFQTADITERLVNDVEVMENQILEAINTMAMTLVFAVAIVWGSFLTLAVLVITLSASIICLLIDSFFSRKKKFVEKIMFEKKAKLTQHTYDLIHGTEQLVMSGRYEYDRGHNYRLFLSKIGTEKKSMLINMLHERSNQFIDFIAYVFLLWYLSTHSQLGLIMASIFYYSQVKGFIDLLRSSYSNIYIYSSSYDRLNEIKENRNSSKNGFNNSDVDINNSEQLISFRNVGYYENGYTIIDNLSFEILKGEKVAIVGPNGSGKSTLLRLLMGLYTPTSGSVVILGKNSSDLTDIERRELFSYSPVTPQLFPVGLKENLQYVSNSDQIIEQTFKENWINRFLFEELNNGPEMQIEHLASNISSGQAQRISIIREKVSPGIISVLDEPTAHLDVNNNRDIINTYLVSSKTLVMVTHRNESLSQMDRIIVLNKGELVFNGSYQYFIKTVDFNSVSDNVYEFSKTEGENNIARNSNSVG